MMMVIKSYIYSGLYLPISWDLFFSIVAMPPKKKTSKSTTVTSKRKAAVLSESENEQHKATKSKLATVASKRKRANLSESENEDGNEKSSLRYSFFSFFFTMTVPDSIFSDDNFIVSDDENVDEYDVEYVYCIGFSFLWS